MSVRSMAWTVLLVASVGCAARQSTLSATARIEPGVYTIRIAAATIEPRRPDGSPWHVRPADNTPVAIGAAAGLAVGNPQLGMKIGEAFADKGGDPEAPIPYVALKVAGSTWTIAPTQRTYSPTWDQPIEINARTLTGEEPVVIQVFDAVDDSLLAQLELPLVELLGVPAQTLTKLGGAVRTLDVQTSLHAELSTTADFDDRGD